MQRTPQDKKRLSLSKDGRNTYRENDKSSRRAIRLRKRWVNRAYRRATKQVVDGDAFEDIGRATAEVRRKTWRKSPDTPLGAKLLADRNRGLARALWTATRRDAQLCDKLSTFLARNMSGARRRVVERRSMALLLDRSSCIAEFNARDLDLLEQFINGQGKS